MDCSRVNLPHVTVTETAGRRGKVCLWLCVNCVSLGTANTRKIHDRSGFESSPAEPYVHASSPVEPYVHAHTQTEHQYIHLSKGMLCYWTPCLLLTTTYEQSADEAKDSSFVGNTAQYCPSLRVSLRDVTSMFTISPRLDVGQAGVVEDSKLQSWARRTAEVVLFPVTLNLTLIEDKINYLPIKSGINKFAVNYL